MKKKITGKTKFVEILRNNEKAAQILFESGLYCVGCPAAAYETLEQGCKAHGMTKAQINKIITKLNQKKKK